MYLPSAVSSALEIVAKHATLTTEIEPASYGAAKMLLTIQHESPLFIIVPNDTDEGKTPVSFQALEILLRDSRRNFRQNIDTVAVTDTAIIHKRFVKQLNGTWLCFNWKHSLRVIIDADSLMTYKNHHELMRVIRCFNVNLTISEATESQVA